MCLLEQMPNTYASPINTITFLKGTVHTIIIASICSPSCCYEPKNKFGGEEIKTLELFILKTFIFQNTELYKTQIETKTNI